MKTAMILLLGLLHFVGAAGATTRSSLKALFGEPVDGSYVVRPAFKIRVTLGPDREPCLLTSSGSVSERELMHTFEMAVPKASRGLNLGGHTECMGACLNDIQFEKVYFRSMVNNFQALEPDAVVIFKRKSCPSSANALREFSFTPKEVAHP